PPGTASLPLKSVAFSPDDRWVLTGGGRPRLWEADTGRELRRFGALGCTVAGVFPRGRFVLAGRATAPRQVRDTKAGLWNTLTGKEVRGFEGHDKWVQSVAFSADGRFVLTGSGDKTARLWAASTGRELQRFEGHANTVSSVALSPDGRFVLTGTIE